MKPPVRPLFLERRSYRQRRLTDAARLAPVLGVVLWSVPLLWTQGPGGMPTSRAIFYIFGVWALLAGLAALLVRNLDPDEDSRRAGGAPEDVT